MSDNDGARPVPPDAMCVSCGSVDDLMWVRHDERQPIGPGNALQLCFACAEGKAGVAYPEWLDQQWHRP